MLTESDHHSIELNVAFGIGMDAYTEEVSTDDPEVETPPPAQRFGVDREGTSSYFGARQTLSATRGASNSVAMKGGGGIDVSVANSDPLRMIGVEAAISDDSESSGSVEVECTVTLLGHQVDHNFCECSGSECGDSRNSRAGQDEQQEISVRQKGRHQRRMLQSGLDRYGFEDDAGVLLTHVFSEITFVEVSIRFFILWVPLSIELSVSGQVWGKMGVYLDVLSGNFEARGGVQPGASAVMTIEVALDLFIVRAGVGGELNIVDTGVPLAATVKPSYTPGVCLSLAFSLELLAGRIYAFIELNLIFFSVRTEVTLVEWGPLATFEYDLMEVPNNCYAGAVARTPSPTNPGTQPPTVAPTAYPTLATQPPSSPTRVPTRSPTRHPTRAPTRAARENAGRNCWDYCSQRSGRCDWCGSTGYCCRNSGWGGQSGGCWNTGSNHGRHICQYRGEEEEEVSLGDSLDSDLHESD